MRSRGEETKKKGLSSKNHDSKEKKRNRRKTEKPKNLSRKFRMNEDERIEKKQKKMNNNKETKKKKTQKPNQRESDKKRGRPTGCPPVTLSGFFTEGVEKSLQKLCVCCSWFFVCGHEISVFIVFCGGHDNGYLGSKHPNLQASWLSTP